MFIDPFQEYSDSYVRMERISGHSLAEQVVKTLSKDFRLKTVIQKAYHKDHIFLYNKDITVIKTIFSYQ